MKSEGGGWWSAHLGGLVGVKRGDEYREGILARVAGACALCALEALEDGAQRGAHGRWHAGVVRDGDARQRHDARRVRRDRGGDGVDAVWGGDQEGGARGAGHHAAEHRAAVACDDVDFVDRHAQAHLHQ